MRLYINKGYLTCLQDRFRLTGLPDDPVLALPFNPQVVATTDLDRAMSATYILTSTGLAVTATGWVVGHTVPKNERWKLLAWTIGLLTGTWTWDGVALNDGTSNGWLSYYPTSKNSQYAEVVNNGTRAEPNWLLQFHVDTKAVNGTAFSIIVYEKELYLPS